MSPVPSPTPPSRSWADQGLYALVVCIWGSSWVGLRLQVGTDVPVLDSVLYRFGLSALVLFGWCLLRGIPLRHNRHQHYAMAAQGILLFAINYVLFYNSARYLPGGLIAILFSTVVIMNLALGALFLGARLDLRVCLGAAFGLLGIGVVFIPELQTLSLESGTAKGIAFALSGTVCAALGMTLSARNQRHGIGVMATNAWGMGYAALALLAAVVVTGTPLRFDTSLTYVGGLLYLSLISSVVAFAAYLTLVGRIGVARASYSTVLFPILALILSTYTDGYHWTWEAFAGIALVLFGNVLVLYRPRPVAAPVVETCPQVVEERV